MRNFLKYPNIELRRQNAPFEEIQGASFKSAKHVKLQLDNNLVTFRAPRHDPRLSHVEQRKPWHKDNLLECGSINYQFMPSDRWRKLVVFFREWVFCAPWFYGSVSSLSSVGVVITRNPEKNSAIKELSVFHPKVFEDELCHYLTDYYGHQTYDEEASYLAPVNWKPCSINSMFACCYDVSPSRVPNVRDRHLAFPITDQHIFILSFDTGQMVEPTNIQNGQCDYMQVGTKRFFFDEAPFLELMENIINSVTIELSSKNQAAYDKIRQENPDLKMQVSDTMLPLKWPVK